MRLILVLLVLAVIAFGANFAWNYFNVQEAEDGAGLDGGQVEGISDAELAKLKAMLPEEIDGMSSVQESSDEGGLAGIYQMYFNEKYSVDAVGGQFVELVIAQVEKGDSEDPKRVKLLEAYNEHYSTGPVTYKGFQGLEEYSKKGRTASLYIFVGTDIFVGVRGSNVPMDLVISVLNQFDLAALELPAVVSDASQPAGIETESASATVSTDPEPMESDSPVADKPAELVSSEPEGGKLDTLLPDKCNSFELIAGDIENTAYETIGHYRSPEVVDADIYILITDMVNSVKQNRSDLSSLKFGDFELGRDGRVKSSSEFKGYRFNDGYYPEAGSGALSLHDEAFRVYAIGVNALRGDIEAAVYSVDLDKLQQLIGEKTEASLVTVPSNRPDVITTGVYDPFWGSESAKIPRDVLTEVIGAAGQTEIQARQQAIAKRLEIFLPEKIGDMIRVLDYDEPIRAEGQSAVEVTGHYRAQSQFGSELHVFLADLTHVETSSLNDVLYWEYEDFNFKRDVHDFYQGKHNDQIFYGGYNPMDSRGCVYILINNRFRLRIFGRYISHDKLRSTLNAFDIESLKLFDATEVVDPSPQQGRPEGQGGVIMTEIAGFLPSSFSGFRRIAAPVISDSVQSTVTAFYQGKDDNSQIIEISIEDSTTEEGPRSPELEHWAGRKFYSGGDGSYTKAGICNRYPCREKYDAGKMAGSLEMFVGDQFIVAVEGENVSIETIRKVMRLVDLKKLHFLTQ